MLKPICVPCERFMRPKKNGLYFLEGMPPGNNPPSNVGKGAIGWAPYMLWAGDVWECPTCYTQIISGTGRSPLSEHYLKEFVGMVKRTNAILMIKDYS